MLNPAGNDDTPLSLKLQVSGRDPLVGEVEAESGERYPFLGWMSFAAAIDAALARQDPPPAV
ncbi:hypothetical protein DSM112329_04145 [Paraconexibacter sp. AEG42_29]|uniref:Uncharacterized protein n=1 Tax=Paraconexibacter sp. AEG42_29 TaxID=2997339 RepID=A0AAU7B110_9ACTN